MLTLGSTSITVVSVIALIALGALVCAFVLRRQVLAAPEGTPKMQDIAQGVQEGASAYLNRQFRTLALFAVVVFALLFLLPGESGVRVGRSVAFLFGAGCSAAIGYLGLWLAGRANVRGAPAATRPGGRAEVFAGALLVAALTVLSEYLFTLGERGVLPGGVRRLVRTADVAETAQAGGG
jgi:K(+)-stimulated pyrophosphate-energized sodium pump